ncbi:hypothetical protein BT63DRAFT_449726 [Microthyrium microscopicum]|uniref:Uncharacterized protein n=1 Tax=Microthyrium microscopicum TaxID=703497 RepID=A0A6A6UR46_9PEZI|nr:hypothetical protein BT63DRAFT_449726 [Microthyrium microscopicum]
MERTDNCPLELVIVINRYSWTITTGTIPRRDDDSQSQLMFDGFVPHRQKTYSCRCDPRKTFNLLAEALTELVNLRNSSNGDFAIVVAGSDGLTTTGSFFQGLFASHQKGLFCFIDFLSYSSNLPAGLHILPIWKILRVIPLYEALRSRIPNPTGTWEDKIFALLHRWGEHNLSKFSAAFFSGANEKVFPGARHISDERIDLQTLLEFVTAPSLMVTSMRIPDKTGNQCFWCHHATANLSDSLCLDCADQVRVFSIGPKPRPRINTFDPVSGHKFASVDLPVYEETKLLPSPRPRTQCATYWAFSWYGLKCGWCVDSGRTHRVYDQEMNILHIDSDTTMGGESVTDGASTQLTTTWTMIVPSQNEFEELEHGSHLLSYS